jgi:hypothetical protein
MEDKKELVKLIILLGILEEIIDDYNPSIVKIDSCKLPINRLFLN